MPCDSCKPKDSEVSPPIRQVRLAPLGLVATRYQEWKAVRRLIREVRDAERRLAAATAQELAQFHEDLWSIFPDAVERVRDRIRKEEHSGDERPRR